MNECAPSGALAGGRILVMEDIAILGRILRRMLEHLGYRCEFVTDGRAALDAYRKAKAAGDPFSAVILDLTVLGGMGGKETLGLLKAFDPQAKAIVSSGYSNDPSMSGYSAHGFSGALVKPFNIHALSEVLRRLSGPDQTAAVTPGSDAEPR
ncbi:MAG: response regulator [Elusimicrobia bacterium]|nr:response regulator [Elusimicrobiota bacterium]